MVFRKQPLPLFTGALIIFGLTAILPVSYMLGQFIARLFERPSEITHVFVDTRQLILLGRSLAIALLATFVAFVIGLPVAVIIVVKDLSLRRLFYFFVLIPVLIPPYVMAGAWIHLFSPTGLLNRTIAEIIGPSAKLTVHSASGCAWCLGISFFPIIAIIVASGLSQLDTNLLDVARLSTNRWRMFWYSMLPQIWPHLIASVCLVLIFVLSQYGVPSLLGINTYPVEIFAQFSAFYNDTAAVATSLPLIVLVVFLVLLQQRTMRTHDYVRITPSSETSNSIYLASLKPYAVMFLAILFVITIVLPFTNVFAYAQSLGKILSTAHSFGDAILATAVLALLAGFISTVIAFPIGHRLAYSHSSFTKIVDIVCWLPIAIPGTITGLGLIKLASKIPVLKKWDSLGILLLLAYIGMFSAFSIRVFHAAYRRADPNVDEAAAIDCQCWYQRLWHIDLPVHSGAITISFILVSVLAVGELNATVLLIPPGRSTLAVSIDNLLHYGASATASALCLIEAGLVILMITFGLFMWRAIKKVFG
jgi:iron(III) transport system permease protein